MNQCPDLISYQVLSYNLIFVFSQFGFTHKKKKKALGKCVQIVKCQLNVIFQVRHSNRALWKLVVIRWELKERSLKRSSEASFLEVFKVSQELTASLHKPFSPLVSSNVTVLPASMPLIVPFIWPKMPHPLVLCLSKFYYLSQATLRHFHYEAISSLQPCTISILYNLPALGPWTN